MPPSHPVVIGRLVFVGLFTAPSVRQYYIYVTDTRCKRLGTQCWVYIAILVSEAILCIKNGKELFERTQVKNIVVWLIIQAVLSVLFVYGCMLWHRYVEVSDRIRKRNVLLNTNHRDTTLATHCRKMIHETDLR